MKNYLTDKELGIKKKVIQPEPKIESDKKWSVGEIRSKLETDDEWVLKGLLAVHSRQTVDEQAMYGTKHINGMGFNKFDANFLTSLAVNYKKYGSLTRDQIFYCRKAMIKYSKQITRISNGEI